MARWKPAPEVFLAMMALTGDEHGIHIPWCRDALTRLPRGFRERARALSGSAEMWPVLADVLESTRPDVPFDRLLSTIAGLDIAKFQREILLGGLHGQELVSSLLAGTRTLLIRLDISDDTYDISCSCVGRLPLSRLEAAYVVQSVFNEKRLWSIYEHGPSATICVPYFDPGISVAIEPRAKGEPAFDPALVFRALGEPTRYEIVRLIAGKPRTSAELARVLELSKPTVSHHVQQLRSAGLVGEEAAGAGVRLSLRKEVIARLSDAALADLRPRKNTKAPAAALAGAPGT